MRGEARSPSGGRRGVAVMAAWGVIFLLAGLLELLRQVVHGEPLAVARAFARQAPILLLWALATPAVLSWARRWPVRGPRWRSHLAVHACLGLSLVLGLNAAIRVPVLWAPDGGGADFLASLGLGLSIYLPGALLAYGFLVLVGDVLARRAIGARHGAAAEGDCTGDPTPARIAVRTPLRTNLVPLDEIVWVEADDNYVRIHTDRRCLRTRTSIGAVEEELPEGAFVRIHRSHLVRVERIRQVQPLGNGDHVVVMDDGAELRVARSRRSALSEALGTPV